MGRIAEETIEQIVAATDIVDLISGYFPLKKAGSSYKANCPFHNEKTPSFNVSPQKQAYYCFGCGAGGGAITFVKEYENLPFVDAVKKLAQKAGIPIIEDAYDPEADKRRRHLTHLREIHYQATEFFHQLLMRSPEASHARSYLKTRGISAEVAKSWQLGWIPDSPQPFLNWAKQKGYRGRDLVASGIAALKDEQQPQRGLYLRFRDRLMFPIHNDHGDVIAFSGRVLQSGLPTGKYVNSPETALFNKSRTIFGLDRARRPMMKAGKVLICEGQLDVIACAESGIEYAVAPLGTAFTADHAKLLKRFTQEAVLCFDSDSAGRKAVERAFRELVAAGIGVKVVDMPDGEDPDSLLKSEGAEAFAKRIEGALDFFDFKLQHAAKDHNLSDPSQRSELTMQVAALLSGISDAVALDTLIQRLAGKLQVGTESLREFIGKAKIQEQRGRQRDFGRVEVERIHPTRLDPACATLCKLALESPEAQQALYEQVEQIHDFINFMPEFQLLLHLISQSPNPNSPSEVQSCLSGLNAADNAALQALLQSEPITDPIVVIDEIFAKLSAEAIRHQLNQLEARLHQTSDAEELGELMSDIRDLHALLTELSA